MDPVYDQIMRAWAIASGRTSDRRQILYAVHSTVLDGPPPAHYEHITNAMDLCDAVHREREGRSLSTDERASLLATAVQARGMLPDVAAPTGGLAAALITVLLLIKPILIVMTIIAVIWRGWSWVLVTVVALALIENGFARFLAGGRHPAAGLHSAIATLLIVSSLVLGLGYCFGLFALP